MLKKLYLIAICLIGFIGYSQTKDLDKNITIELLVVDYEHGDRFDWGIDVTMGSSGNFSDVNYGPGSENTASFSYSSISSLDPAFKLNLSALIQNEYASIVTNPHISVKNGEAAKMHSKEVRHVILQTASLNGQTSELVEIDAGVKLDVVPVILNDSILSLKIDGVISEFAPFSLDGEYRIETKDISTDINIESGETLIIGGLIQSKEEVVEGKVPFFGDIPLLGYLFRKEEKKKVEIEQVIYLTPYIHGSSGIVKRKFEDLVEEQMRINYRKAENRNLSKKEERKRRRAEKKRIKQEPQT